jgi:hypothetical protein
MKKWILAGCAVVVVAVVCMKMGTVKAVGDAQEDVAVLKQKLDTFLAEIEAENAEVGKQANIQMSDLATQEKKAAAIIAGQEASNKAEKLKEEYFKVLKKYNAALSAMSVDNLGNALHHIASQES